MKDINLKPVSALDAVNKIIASIGEAPVSTLENLTNLYAINAYEILKDENRTFQGRGWPFNKNENSTYFIIETDGKTSRY